MAEDVWQLQDSPIFWFAAPPVRPPVRVSGYTSYDLALTVPDIGAQVLPEVEAAMRRGDVRYLRSS